MPVAPILIACVGNIFLGDDGFGVEVAKRLSSRELPPEARLADFGIRSFDLTYALLDGYEQVRDFDRAELALIEPLRTLRLIHYSAWLARRWDDPAFPAAFPWFGTSDYWKGQVQMLEEQLEAMAEPPVVA